MNHFHEKCLAMIEIADAIIASSMNVAKRKAKRATRRHNYFSPKHSMRRNYNTACYVYPFDEEKFNTEVLKAKDFRRGAGVDMMAEIQPEPQEEKAVMDAFIPYFEPVTFGAEDDFTAEDLHFEEGEYFKGAITLESTYLTDEMEQPAAPRYTDPEYCYNGCDNPDDAEVFDVPAVMHHLGAGPCGLGGMRTLGFSETHF